MRDWLVTEDRKDLSNSLVQFPHLKNGKTEAQGGNKYFSRDYISNSVQCIDYFLMPIILQALASFLWISGSIRNSSCLCTTFPKVRNMQNKAIMVRELNPENAGLNKMKQVFFGFCLVLCPSLRGSFPYAAYDRSYFFFPLESIFGICALWHTYEKCDFS